ncbi:MULTISPECIES: S41 family peptidase [Thermoactinomyces]|jgi:carboxyl-terminal processing protease|uniref:S41 family peptidase n=1 Tax=Thermoactinomyces vulgaris TaxID=2026 RepID=A0ABS0QGQ5_THEVU|nr:MULTISPECIES: S41 family peptidase [Thermoactinomyces]KFZ39545.1 peptidase S41 [Thermoactinomyces sp. Gus2-1]KYQ86262.1 peptidase S41 [Thermoactinomyces sp. AS95]MBA4550976.1 S41 family peptidase [Thermoactinomyces vulgaris]MBA4597065.1 S41 family peptidase [Thermoactinomyces vulgaris]MBH8583520.1 S41 family peptidase [Thermoactinomyces sp. CICC 10735]
MNFKGRTVAIITVVTMIFSSLLTVLVVGDGGLIDQLESGTLFSFDRSQSFETHEGKLKQAYQTITSSYLHKVNEEQLIDGAIKGMIESLGDPYSAYMSPKEAAQFEEDLQSSFTGIGAEVTLTNGQVTIIAPIKDSPAEKAGLRAGDQVLKVNGQSLEGMDIQEAVSKIRGPKGSKAQLLISRPGVSEPLNITVVRDEISLQTVEATMLPDKIGRITLTQFSENTAEDFAKELKKLEDQGINGLVIDVRGNPGGLLQSVLEICDQLVPGKKRVLMTEDKSGSRTEYHSKQETKKPYPITVLIDKGSASASEILAAALKESGGYPLVGETTFGKGTVQTTKSFDDGSNLKLTIAKWLTPEGNWIDQHGGTKGIKPDVPVKKPAYANVLPPQPDAPLKKDDNSTEVKNMQLILDALGYHPGRTDGYFDGSTEQAVKSFQKKEGIPETGQLDEVSSDKLRQAFINFLRDPKNDVTLQVAVELLKKK